MKDHVTASFLLHLLEKSYFEPYVYIDRSTFLPRRVNSGWSIVVSLLVRTSVPQYVQVCMENFLISNNIFRFWDHHISSTWRILNFSKKNDFIGLQLPFFGHFSN